LICRPSAAGRFELHELVRQFAAEQLRGQPALEAAAQAAHGHYYAALVAEQYAALKGAGQQAALALIDADIDNVRAAWLWALAAPDTEPLCRMEPALMLFYEHRSWFAEGRAAMLQAVERLRTLTATNAPLGLALGQALVHAGWFMWRCSQLEDGRALLREGCAFLQAHDNLSAQGEALVFLGSVESSLGRANIGIRLIQQGIATYERASDQWGIVNSMYRYGLHLMLQGEYVLAQQILFACVPRVRAVRDTLGIVSVLDRLGAVSLLLGQYDLAERLLQESLLHSTAANHGRGMSRTLQHLGRVAHARGDYGVALYLYQESQQLCDALGDELAAAWMLTQMAYTLLALQRVPAARDAVLRARRTARATKVVPLGLDVLTGHAALLLHTDQAERAVELLGLVLYHAASEQSTRDRAARTLRVAEDQLTPYTVAAALARGRQAALATELEAAYDPNVD
jgi:tetratricopeptide (TPR) repeat protein